MSITPAPHPARVYLAYHKESAQITSRALRPLQVGRALAPPLPGMEGDDRGDNISALNPEYCELTAQFWAWRNDPGAGRVGLMHYRRLLDVAGRHPARTAEILRPGLDLEAYATATDQALARAPEDILAPRPLRLRRSLRAQYGALHDGADLAALEAAVAARRPDFSADLGRALAGNRLIAGNIFVMRRDIFDHYSELLFDVLAAVRVSRGECPRDPYQRRYLGFLGERMLSAYVLGDLVRQQFPGLRIGFRTVLNIDARVIASASPAEVLRHALVGRIGARGLWQRLIGRGPRA